MLGAGFFGGWVGAGASPGQVKQVGVLVTKHDGYDLHGANDKAADVRNADPLWPPTPQAILASPAAAVSRFPVFSVLAVRHYPNDMAGFLSWWKDGVHKLAMLTHQQHHGAKARLAFISKVCARRASLCETERICCVSWLKFRPCTSRLAVPTQLCAQRSTVWFTGARRVGSAAPIERRSLLCALLWHVCCLSTWVPLLHFGGSWVLLKLSCFVHMYGLYIFVHMYGLYICVHMYGLYICVHMYGL